MKQLPVTSFSMLASIREAECIGCTKCISACPVDAIVGAAKHMHTVLGMECIGCELCVPACPVDCIDMLATLTPPSPQAVTVKSDRAHQRFRAREQRLGKGETQEAQEAQEEVQEKFSVQRKQDYIQAAIARVKAKRNSNSR